MTAWSQADLAIPFWLHLYQPKVSEMFLVKLLGNWKCRGCSNLLLRCLFVELIAYSRAIQLILTWTDVKKLIARGPDVLHMQLFFRRTVFKKKAMHYHQYSTLECAQPTPVKVQPKQLIEVELKTLGFLITGACGLLFWLLLCGLEDGWCVKP